MMQFNLPDKYKKNMKTFLPKIDVVRIFWNFDIVFLGSTVVSAVLLWVNLKVRDWKYANYIQKED